MANNNTFSGFTTTTISAATRIVSYNDEVFRIFIWYLSLPCCFLFLRLYSMDTRSLQQDYKKQIDALPGGMEALKKMAKTQVRKKWKCTYRRHTHACRKLHT